MPNIKVANLSGGLFRTATPTTPPRISWTDMANFDIENSQIKTRRGATQYNSTPIYPGCLQFGFSDNQRVHYLHADGGDYGPDTSMEYWNCFWYSKELSSVTSYDANLISFADTNGNALIEMYWDTDGTLHVRTRPHASHSWNDYNGNVPGGDYISRTSSGDHIYGVSIYLGAADEYTVTLWDSNGLAHP